MRRKTHTSRLLSKPVRNTLKQKILSTRSFFWGIQVPQKKTTLQGDFFMIKYDKRHTTKPHTKEQWNYFYRMTKSFKTEILAYKYGVSKHTIYNWKWEYKSKRGNNNGRINIRNNTSSKI